MSANVRKMAYTGAAPWWVGLASEDHGQGLGLGDALVNAETMLDASGLNYEVGKSPLFTFPTKDSYREKAPVRVNGAFSIVRSDTLQPLPGVTVGEGYTVIQNREVFSVLDEVTGAQGAELAHYETAGELNNGTVWMLLALNREKYIAGDKLKTYLLATTAHDGSSALRIRTCETRVVCQNTVSVALGEASPSVSIRHTRNYGARLDDAKRILGTVRAYDAAFDEFASQLLATKIPTNSQTMRNLTDLLFPVPAEATQRVLDNVNDERTKFGRALYVEDLANVRETGWGVLQAVADYAQHRRDIRAKDDDARLARLFERSFEDNALVTKATEFLLAVR